MCCLGTLLLATHAYRMAHLISLAYVGTDAILPSFLQEVAEPAKVMGPDALLKQKIKQKRFRDGYAEGLSSLHRQTSAAAFIGSDNPVEMLGQFTRCGHTFLALFPLPFGKMTRCGNPLIQVPPVWVCLWAGVFCDLTVQSDCARGRQRLRHALSLARRSSSHISRDLTILSWPYSYLLIYVFHTLMILLCPFAGLRWMTLQTSQPVTTAKTWGPLQRRLAAIQTPPPRSGRCWVTSKCWAAASSSSC